MFRLTPFVAVASCQRSVNGLFNLVFPRIDLPHCRRMRGTCMMGKMGKGWRIGYDCS